MAKTNTLYEQAGSNFVMVRRAITVNALGAAATQDVTNLPRGFTPTYLSYYIPALGASTGIDIGWTAGLNDATLVTADPDGLATEAATTGITNSVDNVLLLATLTQGTFDDDVTVQLTNTGASATTASDLVIHIMIGGFTSADGADYLEV